LAKTDSLFPSDDIKKFIKTQNTFSATPRKNATGTGYVVGYGSPVTVGMTIGGKTITSSDMSNISNMGNDLEKGFKITKDEAKSLLDKELVKVGDWVHATAPNTEFTQKQYDGITSFVHNIGIG